MTNHSNWTSAVRGRLRTLRQEGGVTVNAASAGVGKSSLVNIEGHTSNHVYLDQLVPIAKNIGHPMRRILRKTWQAAVPKPLSEPRIAAFPSSDDLHDQTRRNIRHLRQLRGMGTPALAEAIGLGDHSTLVRLESGEYKRLALGRLELIARALGVSPVDLILTDLTALTAQPGL